MERQNTAFCAAMWMDDNDIKPRMLLMDNDTKFCLAFREFWKSMGVRPKPHNFKHIQVVAMVKAATSRR